MGGQRQCWTAVSTELIDGKYVACLVTEGEPGYQAARGNPAQFQTPWFLTVAGQSFEDAKRAADEWSARDFGLSAEECHEIVSGSIIEQIRNAR